MPAIDKRWIIQPQSAANVVPPQNNILYRHPKPAQICTKVQTRGNAGARSNRDALKTCRQIEPPAAISPTRAVDPHAIDHQMQVHGVIGHSRRQAPHTARDRPPGRLQIWPAFDHRQARRLRHPWHPGCFVLKVVNAAIVTEAFRPGPIGAQQIMHIEFDMIIFHHPRRVIPQHRYAVDQMLHWHQHIAYQHRMATGHIKIATRRAVAHRTSPHDYRSNIATIARVDQRATKPHPDDRPAAIARHDRVARLQILDCNVARRGCDHRPAQEALDIGQEHIGAASTVGCGIGKPVRACQTGNVERRAIRQIDHAAGAGAGANDAQHGHSLGKDVDVIGYRAADTDRQPRQRVAEADILHQCQRRAAALEQDLTHDAGGNQRRRYHSQLQDAIADRGAAVVIRGPCDGQPASAGFHHRPIAGELGDIGGGIIIGKPELQRCRTGEITGDVIHHPAAAPIKSNRQRIGLRIIIERRRIGIRQSAAKRGPVGQIADCIAVGGNDWAGAERIGGGVGCQAADQQFIYAIVGYELQRHGSLEIGRQAGGQVLDRRALVGRPKQLEAIAGEEPAARSHIEGHCCNGIAGIGRKLGQAGRARGGTEPQPLCAAAKQRIGIVLRPVGGFGNITGGASSTRATDISEAEADRGRREVARNQILGHEQIFCADRDPRRVDLVEHEPGGKAGGVVCAAIGQCNRGANDGAVRRDGIAVQTAEILVRRVKHARGAAGNIVESRVDPVAT